MTLRFLVSSKLSVIFEMFYIVKEFIMRKLLILSIAILFFSCETTTDTTAFPTEPQTGIPEPLAKKGGGDEATFSVVFEGGVVEGAGCWTKILRKGSKTIQLQPVELTFNGVSDCLDGRPYEEILMIQRHDKNDPESARIMFWFEGPGLEGLTPELTYILVMDGTFDDHTNWPPAVDVPVTINLTSWHLDTEGNPKKYKNEACVLNPFPSSGFITVTVTRGAPPCPGGS